jgi:hypothetical protein
MGILAPKTNNNASDTGLKIVLAVPQGTTNNASSVKRCVIVDTLIGGMRTEKDSRCN